MPSKTAENRSYSDMFEGIVVFNRYSDVAKKPLSKNALL